MQTTNQQKAYILAILAVLMWSTVSTAFKIALKQLDFIQLLFVASLVSLTIFLVYSILTNKIKEILAQNIKQIAYSALVAAINPTAYYLVLFKAYSLLPAQIAQPLNYTWPFVLTLLSAFIFKQKLNSKIIIAFFISLLAVFVIASQGNLNSFDIKSPWGIFLALFSSLFWSIYWILNLKDNRNDIVKLFWSFLFSTIYISLICYLFSNFNIKISNSLWAAVYTGLFELGFTFIVWLAALRYSKSTAKISNLIYLSPVLALFFIHFVLKEKIYFTTFIGLFMIIFSILYLNKSKNIKNSQ